MEKFSIYCCLAVAVTGLIFTSCDLKKSASPVESNASDYTAYFYDEISENWIFEYNPASATIDSFQVPIDYIYRGIQSSPDGSILYVGGENSTLVVDVKSRTVVHEIPYSGAIAVSPDGQHIAIGNSSLYIIQISGYSVVYSDDLGGYDAAFSADGTKLYRGYGQYILEPFGVRIIDLADNYSITNHSLPIDYLHLTKVVPSADEKLWYLYFNTTCFGAFGVYDTELDSIIYLTDLAGGHGQIRTDPVTDGVYFTDPGPRVAPDICRIIVPSEYYLYDPATNSVTTQSMLGVLPPPHDTFWPIRDLYVSVDAKWLVVLGSNALLSFDLTQPGLTTPNVYEHSFRIDYLTGKSKK